jgi:hypothetical protein
VERYTDATGEHRIDQVVTGGGGAPLYGYQGEPETRQYILQNAAANVRLQHLVRPAVDPGGNPHHYLVVHVDGPKVTLEVIAVSWGQGFEPYRSSTLTIAP